MDDLGLPAGGPFGEGQVELLLQPLEALDEPVVGEDRGGGHGEVGFGLVPLDWMNSSVPLPCMTSLPEG